MTIGTSNRNDAVGNDATTVYPYGFKIFAASDLEVKVSDTSGVETTLTYPTDFAVSGVGSRSGGNVTLNSIGAAWQNADGTLKSSYAITIRRVRPLTQTSDIRNQGGFFADVHEDTFDHLVMIDQQQQDELDRALKLPTTEDGTDAATALPSSSARIGKFLAFDAAGNPTAASGTGADTALRADLAASSGSTLIGVIKAAAGAIARTVQSMFSVRVSIEDFVTNTTPGTTDCTAGLQAAINYVASLGGGTVECLAPPYKIATSSGNVATFPASGATMPYCVELKPKVKLVAPRERTTFVGDWTARVSGTTTAEKIMFRLTETLNGGSFFLDGVSFSKSLLAMYHSGIITGEFRNISFSQCGLPFIAQQAERLTVDGCDIGGKTAGLMIGGWLHPGGSLAVPDLGGWSDKCQFKRINYITFDLGFTSAEEDIDSFFNTHFFVSGGAGGGAIPYRGVVGISLFLVSRYDRGNWTDEISDMFSYGSPRPMVYGGPEYMWTVNRINSERNGFIDYLHVGTLPPGPGESAGGIMGGTGGGNYFADPWAPGVGAAGRMRGLVDVYTAANASTLNALYATATAAIAPYQGMANVLGIFALPNANPDMGGTVSNIGKLQQVVPEGFYSTGAFRYSTVPIGSVAWNAMGTEAVHVAGTIYIASIEIPRNFQLSGLGVLNGGTVGTDKLIYALYDQDGVLVANTALAGTLSAGANVFQEIPFVSTYQVKGPKRYYIAVQCNGVTDKTRRVAASTFINVDTKSQAGVFGTIPASITTTATFAADVGPIAYVW